MMVKKFFGKTTREALRQVREQLGADALILSNRPMLDGGVEIMAVADADVASLTHTLSTAASAHPPRHVAPSMQRLAQTPASQQATQRAVARTYAMPVEPIDTLAEQPAYTAPANATYQKGESLPSARTGAAETIPDLSLSDTVRQSVNNKKDENPYLARTLAQMGQEIKLLRGMLQGQLANFSWSKLGRSENAVQAELFRQLLTAGFSTQLIHQLIEKLPKEYTTELAMKWARSALIHNLKCQDPGPVLMDKGGIFALVGPTGVGKTTTVAKLAARVTQRFGAKHVALISTDSYRVGAQDQLRIYGKILGVPVFSPQKEGDLQLILADLAKCHIVLIDTVGMGQRDNRIPAQIEMLRYADRPIKRILLLSANADGQTLEDVVRRYQGRQLAGCILSKIDEAMLPGAGLDVVIRHRLPLFYVTNGQRVPEDLHSANAAVLTDRALQMAQPDSPFAVQADEISIMNAAQAGRV